ncbi:MAG TPA: protoheme IX farnesyltransferase, partial [Gammaproteobacteria bacterium]|nr:protoheme IX farnesyltransferase [Gammaproteobacteria bacterium]
LVGAGILGAGFIAYAVALLISPRSDLPMRTFGYSITYLMALFALLLVDHYLPH